ncbi:PAQR family membrane homeostasis protein TrhA [Methylotenera versatilis]|uniref:Channel protein, hemolysin III family n=1 Tax=Methylotenera versatilis (strain 301) TaxID=666681 RepID=D7DI45_METV0|nr:hemolysin III family protein [Methylotenera versatilis]ADI29730.1 channel protein, hemolysin III family [Methylotenera versatilis 301]
MRAHTLSLKRDQSRNEEFANSLSHGIGLIAAIVGAPFLIIHAIQHGDGQFIVGVSVFSLTTILLYLASTVYHILPNSKIKRIFNVIDHSIIFLLIAGTYTPFTLGVLRGAWGWALFGVIWGLASIGIILKALNKASHPILSNGLYLLMGWIVVIAIEPLITRMPTAGLLWLLAGGLFYTVGIIFYIFDSRLKYGHLIWHVFVMGGTVCHYFAILWYAQ